MSVITPASRPKLSREEAEKFLQAYDLVAYPVRLLGIRGYYQHSMGDPDRNDRNLYDDAIFILSPDAFCAFNANTDPSKYQPGIAVLKAGGPYLYKIGLHNMKAPYEALRQYGRVTVIRDGGKEVRDTAASPFFIDIHKGGYSTTSSLGCQTIYPEQWTEFLLNVKTEIKKYSQSVIPYVIKETN